MRKEMLCKVMALAPSGKKVFQWEIESVNRAKLESGWGRGLQPAFVGSIRNGLFSPGLCPNRKSPGLKPIYFYVFISGPKPAEHPSQQSWPGTPLLPPAKLRFEEAIKFDRVHQTGRVQDPLSFPIQRRDESWSWLFCIARDHLRSYPNESWFADVR